MLSIDSAVYKYKPGIVDELVAIKNDTTVPIKDFKIMFPSRYVNINVAKLGTTTNVISVYAMIDENNNYCVVNAPILIQVMPVMSYEVYVDSVSYTVLEFEKGGLFMTTNTLVKSSDFTYDLFSEFFLKGNVPWYLNVDMLASIYLESGKYLGNSIGKYTKGFEILTSVIARDRSDKSKLYRYSLKTQKDINNIPVNYIGLGDKYYSYNNTASKLVGSYLKKGIVSSLVTPEKKTTNIARLLKA